MPAKKINKSKASKSRVASFKSLKKSPKYKSSTLVVLLVVLGIMGYFVIRSFAATPIPPKNSLADRFCGTWVLRQIDTNTQLSTLAPTIRHGLDYNNMRGFSLRTNWASVDNNGVFNPSLLDWGKNVMTSYPNQSYSIRVIAGSKSPARLFSMPDMYWYRLDSDNNQLNGDNGSGAQAPLPYNPNSATFAPNVGFEREYTKLVNDMVDYAVANNIKLVHIPWYGRDWAELNYHPELWNEPNFTPDKWVEGHKRLTDIVYNKVKDYPDISVEFAASGWNNVINDKNNPFTSNPYNIGNNVTSQLINYMSSPTVHPLWANWSGRLFVQANGYGKYSGLGSQSATPTSNPIYRGMQMFDQSNNYSSNWSTLYDNLGKAALYGTYLEIYAESFGYDPTNQANLQAGITKFASTKCTNAPADTTAPQVSISSPGNNSTVSGTINVTSNAIDDIGVTKVEFYIDNSLVASSSTSPYSFSWDTNSVTSGTHTIYAKAYDASGKSANSTTVSVTKPAPNQPPTVSISSPAGGAIYSSPIDITINANASDSDGTVSKVEFYSDSNKIGESTTTPFSYNWAGIQNGSYQLSAKATDNQGSTAMSLPVAVTVNSPVISLSPPTNLALSINWDASKWKYYIQANWNPPADTQGVTGYKVKVMAYGALKEFTTVTGADTKYYRIYGINSGAKYTVQAYSIGANDTESSPTAAEKSATVNCFVVCWLTQ